MPSITVNDYPIDYVEAGTGEPLILVHGSLQDQRYWAPQMAGFGAQYRVIAPSLRHYWPARWDGQGGGFTIAQHVADVVALIRAFGPGPVRLLGHSRGGHIAFRVAESHPELLRALVLAEPGGELDASFDGVAAPGEQLAAFNAAAECIRAGRIEEGLSLFAAHTGGPGAWERRPEPRRQVARDNAFTLLGQVHEQRAPYSRAAAAAIRTPTLLVGGAESQPRFGAIIDALEAAIAGAKRATIPKGTHAMSIENPAAFNAAVLHFLTVA
ncbi:alpha/beta hydrolase [Roseomonas hellenica]|uniref:Alpha/beta hydrolase n=1 Tax=Plastoroseomonas hellenica TaxID=2687306 RepID=A0ABS5F5N2_9PROT|nr:alpha/beta hydrolase [Plastoroseomonas hellenica]MBR0667864.1 alpha/beta hydrolase [Plastoroseomonas hellenica]